MPELSHSYVVTGGAQGVGQAIAKRLAQDGFVVIIDLPPQLSWEHENIGYISGSAGNSEVTLRAASLAESKAPLHGWVNNAAIFRDAQLHTSSAKDIQELIFANFSLCLIGVHTAVNHFLGCGRAGAIVNVSSHQAQRPVRGALPYATAKAAVEGLTKATAVDYGSAGIRVNAVALGSIETTRYQELLSQQPEVGAQMAAIHPLGRVGTSNEVADTVAFLLSSSASFISGAVLPIDGGRAILGVDPEAL